MSNPSRRSLLGILGAFVGLGAGRGIAKAGQQGVIGPGFPLVLTVPCPVCGAFTDGPNLSLVTAHNDRDFAVKRHPDKPLWVCKDCGVVFIKAQAPTK